MFFNPTLSCSGVSAVVPGAHPPRTFSKASVKRACNHPHQVYHLTCNIIPKLLSRHFLLFSICSRADFSSLLLTKSNQELFGRVSVSFQKQVIPVSHLIYWINPFLVLYLATSNESYTFRFATDQFVEFSKYSLISFQMNLNRIWLWTYSAQHSNTSCSFH